jgi:hypothetical protein
MYIRAWLVVALLTLSASAAAQTKTEAADVRGVRWGMTKQDVLLAHPSAKLKLANKSLEILQETDLVAGRESFIDYDFTGNLLYSVLITLNTLKEGPQIEGTFYAWEAMLTRRYPASYLFCGEEPIGKLVAAADAFSTVITAFKQQHVEFHVEYRSGERTHVSLNAIIMESDEILNIRFMATPPDNL